MARRESDVGQVKEVLDEIKLDLREIRGEIKAANSTAAAVRGDVDAIKATLPHFATKADLRSLETSVVRWLVGTLIGAVSLAFAIARFVNY